jgi:hypothetical protein
MKNKLIQKIVFQLDAQSNCKRATFLIEKQQHIRLSVKEWFEMQAHLAICPLCTIYIKQSQLLEQMIVKILHKRHESNIVMREEKKAILEKMINEKLNGL